MNDRDKFLASLKWLEDDLNDDGSEKITSEKTVTEKKTMEDFTKGVLTHLKDDLEDEEEDIKK